MNIAVAGTGYVGLSIATLLSQHNKVTACENGNRMLDRGLVVPIPGREECSYFKKLVGDLCQVEI